MVGDDDKGVKRIILELVRGEVNGLGDEIGDSLALEPCWADASLIQIPIHPDEGLAGGLCSWRREPVVRQTAV